MSPREPSFTRAHLEIDDVLPGDERARFLAEVSESLGVNDLDRPLAGMLDELEVLECIMIAEAVWRVELGPRSPTAAQADSLVQKWPTLLALIEAAEAAVRFTPGTPN